MRNNSEPKVYVFFGLIASGKSLLASSWAKNHNFYYFNSDVERKRLAGVDPGENCSELPGEGIYSEDFSRRTYDRLIECARRALKGVRGTPVVLDGSYQKRDERKRLVAKMDSIPVVFIYCYCSESETKERLERRSLDQESVSDGTLEIYYEQQKRFEKPKEIGEELFRLDTDAPLERLMEILDGRFINKKGGSL